MSDTDSTMPTMYKIVKDTLACCGLSDLESDELVMTKLSMFYTAIVTAILDNACLRFVKDCNSYKEGNNNTILK